MINEHESRLVLPLDSPAATLEQVGGKGASLARMAMAGLPVPPGFHITTAAYRRFVRDNGIAEQIVKLARAADPADSIALGQAAEQIWDLFEHGHIPGDVAEAIQAAYVALSLHPAFSYAKGAEATSGEDGHLAVAVRSSATAEDLPDMSFAGQQESYLNMRGATMLLGAVKRCWASLWTARAIGYRARNNIAPDDVALAVVVQTLVPADAAGILFTANPLTGARDQLLINAAWGLGEAIVGGQVTPDTIVVRKADLAIMQQQTSVKAVMTVRTQDGTAEQPAPAELRAQAVLNPAQAADLAGIGVRIEQLYGQPIDVEWALYERQFFVVQARPITTLHEPAAEQWNDSLRGDYLWTSGNVGEAVPDVMTPSAWSLIQIFIGDTMPVPEMDGHPLIGNIGGHFYMNISVLATLAAVFGLGRERFAEANEQAFGRLPDGVELPLVPVSRWRVIRTMLPIAVRYRRGIAANKSRLPAFIAAAPARCEALRARIQATSSAPELIALWRDEVLPFFRECSQMLAAGARQDGTAIVWVRRKLRKLVGEADANALLSGLSAGASHLASLGLLLGLDQLARGAIDRETFARQYGHRGPHEFEISIARPGEDDAWIERQLAGLRAAPADVTALLARQHEAQAAAWARLERRHPRQAARMRPRIDRAAAAFRAREAARSEVIRAFWALRTFVQHAGALSGQGDDLFFLRIEEILAVLGGDHAPLIHVAARRAAYARYSALPPYPAFIRGHFDPFGWAADPQRRGDLSDASGAAAPSSAAVRGFPGAAGVVEGVVHVITSPDAGDQLQSGEILVTTVTNVGWTPLFPRAAAVVTDVGAPLSHAAIVARELGIPAVVGCGNATMRLRTGDRVRVDGGRGTVEIL